MSKVIPEAHSFGGSALDRHLFEFETVTGGDVGAAGAPAGDAGDAGDVGDVGDAGQGAAAPTWQGPSQEEWQQTQEALQQFQSLVQPPVQQQQAQEPSLEFDPFSDNPVEQILEIVRHATAPMSEFVQNQQYTEGEARGKDVLSDLASRDGDFNVDRAYEIGLARYREAAATQPPSWDLYESCLNSAAKDVRSYEQTIATQAVERFKNELAGLGGARQEPGVNTNGSQQFTIPEGGGLMDVVRRHTGGQ